MPLISVCIPAYNRARFLKPLIDSILSQNYHDYEIVICEDKSPEREDIIRVVEENYVNDPRVKLFLNEENLGYDKNFRELLNQSSGEYCFFMGNDDIMAPGALRKVANVVIMNSNIGLILRSYSWFVEDFNRPEQTVKYFDSDRVFPVGAESIGTAYRRTGVLSGYIIHRETANSFATDEFDGFLYYQMYLAASVLTKKRAYYIHDVLTFSRSTESPDFGNNVKESKVFTPGKYTSSARLHMVNGMLTIARSVENKTGVKFSEMIERDIANYVYPYISDQLDLSPTEYYHFYRSMGALGLEKYKMFHIHFIAGYILKEKGYNVITKYVREIMGKTPRIGKLYAGESV